MKEEKNDDISILKDEIQRLIEERDKLQIVIVDKTNKMQSKCHHTHLIEKDEFNDGGYYKPPIFIQHIFCEDCDKEIDRIMLPFCKQFTF